jgi:hypothetical protein
MSFFLIDGFVVILIYMFYRLETGKTVWCLCPFSKWYYKKGWFLRYERFYTKYHNWYPICTCKKMHENWFEFLDKDD